MAATMGRMIYLISVLSVFALGSPDLQYITGPPQNTASVSGTGSTLSCVSDRAAAGVLLNWFATFVGQPVLTTIVQGCELNPALSSSFVLREGTDSAPCDLGIISANRQLAGAYTCRDSSDLGPVFSAQFVVLDSDPVCQIIANVTDIAEGDLILFECEVTYTNNLSPVLISWQQDDSQGVSQAINSTDNVGNGRTVSYIEILAVAPSILPVKALTKFASPLNPPTWSATNTPNYTYEWTTPEITIQYCPYSISITDLPEPLAGDVITCTVNGHPDPTYTWYNLITGESTNGSELTIATPGLFHYQCQASNVIRGRLCSAYASINGTASESVKPPRNAATVFGTNETLICKFGHTPLNWVFAAPDQPGLSIVSSCQVTIPALGYYAVDPSNGGCDLIVLEAGGWRAGTYTCQEVQIYHKPVRAMLVVLESDPVCSTNVTGDFVVNGDWIRLTCVVNYTGELTPLMSWTTSSSDPIRNATTSTSLTQVESFIVMPVFSNITQSFTSRTYFNAPTSFPPGPYPPEFSDPATNAPDYEYIWSSRPLTVID